MRDGVEQDQGDSRRRDGERDVLRAARGRLRPAVRGRRPAAAADGPFHGGGGWLTVLRLLRGLQDSRQAGPLVQRARHEVVAAGRRSSTRRWRESVQERGSDRQATDHRPRGDARVRQRARAADHRRRRRRPRQRAQPDPAAGDVHPAAAGAGPGQRAQREITPVAWVVRTRCRRCRSARRCRRCSARRPACRSRTSARWTRSSSRSTSRSASTCC